MNFLKSNNGECNPCIFAVMVAIIVAVGVLLFALCH